MKPPRYHRANPRSEVTPRELQIVTLIADGYTQREAAEQLGVSFHTVKTHMARLLAKLNVNTSAQAVAVLMQRGLL